MRLVSSVLNRYSWRSRKDYLLGTVQQHTRKPELNNSDIYGYTWITLSALTLVFVSGSTPCSRRMEATSFWFRREAMWSGVKPFWEK
jgi:hypothetical protein